MKWISSRGVRGDWPMSHAQNMFASIDTDPYYLGGQVWIVTRTERLTVADIKFLSQQVDISNVVALFHLSSKAHGPI